MEPPSRTSFPLSSLAFLQLVCSFARLPLRYHRSTVDTVYYTVTFTLLKTEPTLEAMSVLDSIDRLRELAKAQEDGDPVAHGKVLDGVRKLQQQIESPFDTVLRVQFQVRRETEPLVPRSSTDPMAAGPKHLRTDSDRVWHSAGDGQERGRRCLCGCAEQGMWI